MSLVQSVGQLWLLGVRTGRASWREGISRAEVKRQFVDFGNRTAWLVISGMCFFGVVLVTIANNQARRFTGSLAILGAPYFELLVREFGPLVAALLAAARSGASHSAELAQMSVNEQVEALEMSGGDALADLVAPKVLGSLLALPLLAILGTVAAALSAAAAAQLLFDTDGRAFLDPRYIDAADLVSAFVKSVACGIFIPLAAAWQGLGASGGSLAVGWATTRGVVAACVGCLTIDFVLSLSFHLLRI